MNIFNRKYQTSTEKVFDGYSIVSFKKSFVKDLKRKLNKEANKDYENFKKSYYENNLVTVIPTDYNANFAKHRMEVESAIDSEGIVGIKISDSNKYSFEKSDYNNLENNLQNKKAEFMLFNNNEDIFFICANNEHNINLISNTIYEAVIDKKESSGIGMLKKDGYFSKDVNVEEEKFIENKLIDDISKGLYLGNEELALSLLLSNSHLTKIILQNKYKKDLEKILVYLQISHAITNNGIILSNKTFKDFSDTLDGYIHGAIMVKDKDIYGLQQKRVVNEKENSINNKLSIDTIIEKLKDKNKDIQIDKTEKELIK